MAHQGRHGSGPGAHGIVVLVTTLTLLASFEAAPGHHGELRAALLEMVDPSLAEPGCLEYRPYLDAAEPGQMLLVERWVDRAALEDHFATPHFRAVAAKLETLLTRPFEIEELTTVGP